ncbi:nucleotidyltransferase domain-containing protein [Nitratifractor sp.]
MRLSCKEIETLKKAVRKWDEKATIHLFGSRLDDEARGGDIDLLIRSRKIGIRELRHIRLDFFKRFGEQKLDLIVDDGSESDPFVRIIREKAKAL